MAYHVTLDNRPPFKLEDFAIHCNEDLQKGAALVYDGCHWRLVNLGEIAEDLPELIEEFKNLKEELESEIEEAEEKIDEAVAKVEEVAASNPEKVKFITIQMDGDTSTTVYDDFITADSDVILTRISWEPSWIIETYVNTGYVEVRSSEDETWTVRLRISKPWTP